MTETGASRDDFRSHYDILGLSHQASWEAAQVSYRRLVNQWHPDRFENNSSERITAQQQFIDLTKAYRALRAFYRMNQRLPFQSAHNDADDLYSDTGKSYLDSDLDENVLSRDAAYRGAKSGLGRKIAWAAGVMTIMIATITTFFIIDYQSGVSTLEKGKEVVKQAPPSEFMPSAAEIRKQEAKGQFLRQAQ